MTELQELQLPFTKACFSSCFSQSCWNLHRFAPSFTDRFRDPWETSPRANVCI